MKARSTAHFPLGVLLLGFLGAGLVACQRTGAVEAALHRDLAALGASIDRERAAGGFDREATLELAQAILEREITSAVGVRGVKLVRSTRACAGPLARVLEERALGDDEVAAEATLVLIGLSRLDRDKLVVRFRSARDPAWRAVAARAAAGPEVAGYRQLAYEDPDERVRRAALEAGFEARDARDFEALVDRAGHDPDPLNQGLAVRALGAVGGERVVLALVDRWHTAEQALRLSIQDAWAMPEAFRVGGERELVRVTETEVGLPKLAASVTLVRHSKAFRAQASQVLQSFVQVGSSIEQRFAIRSLPALDAPTLAALRALASADDLEVRVTALARLGRVAKFRTEALNGLRKLSRLNDPIVVQARAMMAELNDAGVVPELLTQIRSPRAFYRQLAASALLDLERYSDAIRILGDDDREVRTKVACDLVMTRPG